MSGKGKQRPVGDFLEPLTGTIKRKKFATIDIESKDGDPGKPFEDSQKAGFVRPFMVGLYDPLTREFSEFRDEPHLKKRPWMRRHILPGGCIDKLLNVVLTKRYSGWVFYAHNGGSFDHLFLLAWLRDHLDEFGFEVVPVQSSIQVIRVWRLPDDPDLPIRERWEFLDSMKLLPMGLERACQTFGLPGKVSHDLNMHEDDPRWSLYLKQDCIALATVLSLLYDMVENRLGGEVGMTAPSTSMKLFRRRFLGRDGTPSKISRYAHWLDCKDRQTCEGCFHEWVRQGYYGGRTELFRTFGEKLHYYDINSSYVAAMREDMPVGERIIEDHLDWRRFENYAGFVECTVYVPPECEIPPLPHRDKLTGKLLFPAGRFRGVWSTEELKLLEDPMVNGRIERVKKVVWFRRKPLFVKMVDELWRLRDKRIEGYDEGLSALAKLMGNSLYGKFGMKQDRTSVVFSQNVPEAACFLCRGPALVEGGLCRECEGSKPAMAEPDGDVWYQAKKVEAPYIIPQIAAHITALARVRIWRFMQLAIKAGGKLYYTDTDSIITDAVLPSSSDLGALKDEYPGQELTGLFVQPKVYMLENPGHNETVDRMAELLQRAMEGDETVDASTFDKMQKFEPKVTMKGFPRSLRTKENLGALQEGKTLSYSRLEKVRSLAREGFRRPPLMATVKKSFKSGYDKRRLHKDGSTSPVVLDEHDGALDEAAE